MAKLFERIDLTTLFQRALEYLGFLRVIIDVGSEEIRILEVIQFPGYFRVLSMKSEKVYDIERFSFFMERFLEKNKTHPLGRVTLTLSGTSVIPIFLSFPGIPREKIKSAILWEIEKNIPLPLEESYFSYRVVSSTVENGQTVWNVLAVIAKRDEVDRFVETFERMGILVENVFYLPINIISLVKGNSSDNALGYVYLSSNFIELYVMHRGKIISFSRYIGDFTKGINITIRNLKDYFAEFIKKRITFLERIIVIGKTTDAQDEIISSLFDSLNIVTLPLSDEDLQTGLKMSTMRDDFYDLVGFSYRPSIHLDISSRRNRENHRRDRLMRILVTGFLVLDVITAAILPFILYQNRSYAILTLARKGKPEEIRDAGLRQEVLKTMETLSNVMLVDAAKTQQNDLIRKINDIRSSGIESSTLHNVLSELAGIIPEDVWVNSLSIASDGAEMSGSALSSEGLERFVEDLVASRVLNSVVLRQAEYVKTGSEKSLKFTIGFGVNK
jgi:Tfp pilus assembly protein PilN